MTVTLEMAKKHLRVRHNDEDSLIAGYVVAAHSAIVRFIGEEYGNVPELDQAELLLIGMAYEDREGVSKAMERGSLPPPILMLIRPFRRPTIA